MFPAQFNYERAKSIEEAVDTLARYGGDARVVAGGQSLIPAMRYRLARPVALVDINPIASLAYLREVDGRLAIGALTRDFDIEISPSILERYPLIADASGVVADPIVRQNGTLVGSLCHNDPAGDWPVVALAARASIVLRDKNGERTVAIDDLIVDSYATCIADGEMAVEAWFPAPAGRTSGAYVKIERKVGDFATACAGVRVALAPDGAIADAGVAIGAVGPTALRVENAEQLLKGATPSIDAVRAAADEARRTADPIADNRGSVEYKREMAAVLVERALRKTFARLGVGGF